ncbi:MAG: hypothetical protein LBK77_03715 [Spirochaetaceae bacterium]|jgi:hypothetical protein|nr:hypothetical protein [Spirochaetaceae bacterium]
MKKSCGFFRIPRILALTALVLVLGAQSGYGQNTAKRITVNRIDPALNGKYAMIMVCTSITGWFAGLNDTCIAYSGDTWVRIANGSAAFTLEWFELNTPWNGAGRFWLILLIADNAGDENYKAYIYTDGKSREEIDFKEADDNTDAGDDKFPAFSIRQAQHVIPFNKFGE